MSCGNTVSNARGGGNYNALFIYILIKFFIMVKTCSAYKCKTIAGDGYSFHKFPRDEALCLQWCLAVRRSNFIPSMHARLCSRHFIEDDFLKNRTGHRQLKPGAVPSIFDFPKNIDSAQKAPLKRQRSHSPETENDTSTEVNEDVCDKKSDKPALVIYLKQLQN